MQHDKKPLSNLKSMQIVGFEQTSTKFIEIFVSSEKKPVVEAIAVAISDSFDVLCFDLYPIYILKKTAKTERCTGVMFRLALLLFICYCWRSNFITKI